MIVALLTLTTGCRLFEEVHEESFTDRADASGLIERGWIPELLPPSASDIHVKYDVDSNEAVVSFSYAPADEDDLGSACTRTPHIPTPTMRASWFPDGVENTAAHSFMCDDGYLVTDGNDGYYWSDATALTVNDLHSDAERYVYLDGRLATVVGYVDFDNIFDRRDTEYGYEAIGFVLKPGQFADAVMFAVFPEGSDPHPLFDRIYAARPDDESQGLRLMATGTISVAEQPTNFSTSLGYEIAVADPEDVSIVGP